MQHNLIWNSGAGAGAGEAKRKHISSSPASLGKGVTSSTGNSINDIFKSTVLAKLVQCSPAWSGFCSAADRTGPGRTGPDVLDWSR